jgi:hypothetical protein
MQKRQPAILSLIGKEVVYKNPKLFDLYGIGKIEGLAQIEGATVVEIEFPETLHSLRQLVPVKIFFEKLQNKEIELLDQKNQAKYQIRKKARQLLLNRNRVPELIEKLTLAESLEILEILKEKIADPFQPNRPQTIFILGEIVLKKEISLAKNQEISRFLMRELTLLLERPTPKIKYSLASGPPYLLPLKKSQVELTKISLFRTIVRILPQKANPQILDDLKKLLNALKSEYSPMIIEGLKEMAELLSLKGITQRDDSFRPIKPPKDWPGKAEDFHERLLLRIVKIYQLYREEGLVKSKKEFAHFLGFPLTTLYRWLAGRTGPSPQRLKIFLEKVGISWSEFIYLPEKEFCQKIKENLKI